MPRKRSFTPEKYKFEILRLLSTFPFMSTSEICDKLNMGYETGLKYLQSLYSSKKIKLRTVGNRNFWFV